LLDGIDDDLPGPGPGVTGLIPDVNGLVTVTDNYPGCTEVPLVTTVLPEYCLPETIVLQSQDEVDNFQIQHRSDAGTPCTKVIGTLAVRRFLAMDSIQNLNGLSGLQFVGGNLEITVILDLLDDIAGFSELATAGRTLAISANHQLPSLSGLGKVKHIGESLIVKGNASLTTIGGFSDLTHLGADLEIEENELLGDCSSLAALLDDVDHGAPGPGIAPIPDVGGEVVLAGNLDGCNSTNAVISPDRILMDGFEGAPAE
jgi:hypothetical protein